MPTLDATALSAVSGPAFAVAFYVWVDFVGDPLYATTFGADVTFSGTGDAELDGKTFIALDPRVVRVGDVSQQEGGSDTLSIEMSWIAVPEPTLTTTMANLIALINDTTKWRGRTVRLWARIYDETGATAQGAVIPYYTGYASSVKITPSAEMQTIEMMVENYMANFNDPSFRSYLNQTDYDAGDLSAQATLAAANMGRGGGKVGSMQGFGGAHVTSGVADEFKQLF